MATKYLRAGASGSGSGDDWTNAYASVANAVSGLSRGDTLYVADGAYGSASWSTAESGTTQITVKKAIAVDHGTETGWDSGYGDGTSDFTRWIFTVGQGYWTLDGQVGAWADSLYGVPAIPGYVQHGFRVQRNTVSDGIGSVLSAGGGVAGLTIKHTEACYTNTPRTSGQWSGSSSIIGSNFPTSLLEDCWLHDAGSVITQQRGGDCIFRRCVLERNGHGHVSGDEAGQHSEIASLSDTPGGNNIYFLECWIRDWRSTGGLMIMENEHENVRAINCIFQDTGYWDTSTEGTGGNGAFSANSAGDVVSAFCYHCTFINLRYDAKLFTSGTITAAAIKNCLFYNCGTVNFGSAPVVHDHNWFFDNTTNSEANGIEGTGDPFVDLADLDLALADDIGTGEDLGADYSMDFGGIARTRWSPGAWEFVADSEDTSDAKVVIARA